MFSTAKEVHIYIEQATQNIASNRKGSISPYFIDMVLNNAVIEYISSKFPSKYNPKDIEGTLKKYSDFNTLKRSIVKPLQIGEGLRKSVFAKLPSSCLRYQTASCNYIRPLPTIKTVTKTKYSVLLSVNDSNDRGNTPTFFYKYRNSDNTVVNSSITFDDVLPSIKSTDGLFYLYDTIIDRFRNICNLDCKFESNDSSNNKVIRVDFPIGISLINDLQSLLYCDSSFISTTAIAKQVECVIDTAGRLSRLSLLSGIEVANTLDDYYGSKNLYLDPVCEMIEDNLVIYYTDFIPSKVEISYIKKPKLFNITSGQIPEIDITKDFLDYAIKEILLILNSQNYDRVMNETIKNL